MNPETFVDIAMFQDGDGLYDGRLDENGDFVEIDTAESAIFHSIFTDRRARADEVADPMKRRGWIGDMSLPGVGDYVGSGVWLYEQRRLLPAVTAGVEAEAYQSLSWMISDGFAKSISTASKRNAALRRQDLIVTMTDPLGNVTSKSYAMWTNTGA